VITGGGKWSGSEGGYYVTPTILSNTTADMKVVQEEVSTVRTWLTQIFGPVIVAATFKDEADGIEVANNTQYGLAAAVFTNDTKQAMRVTAALDAGTVWCNQYALLHTGVPFGGFKQSGIGRELGTYGLEAYTQVKAVHHNLTQTMWV
jgi:aldehyde dehydrogenase (NAD+)